MNVTHLVSQIKTGPTPSELSEQQQRPGKTRGFNKGVGLTFSQGKNNMLHKAKKKKKVFRGSRMIPFSLVPSASVTSLYRATAAFTEKAAGLRGGFLPECQGYLQGGSRHSVLTCPPAHTHAAAPPVSPNDPVSGFHSCGCCKRWTDGQSAPFISCQKTTTRATEPVRWCLPWGAQMWTPRARE